MVDRCVRTDSLRWDPSCITFNLRSLVIRLGFQLEEVVLTHLSTIRFSLKVVDYSETFYHLAIHSTYVSCIYTFQTSEVQHIFNVTSNTK